MRNKSILAGLLLAALFGLVLGNVKSFWQAQPVTAEAQEATHWQLPDWSEIKVLVLRSENASTEDGFSQFDLSTLDAKIQLRYAPDSAAAQSMTQNWPFNVVVIDKTALKGITSDWARAQLRAGAAFVGVNMTPAELGELIGVPTLAKEFTYTLEEPSVTVAYFWASGNPAHIRSLEKMGNLYSFEGENLVASSGFKDVRIGYLIGYVLAQSDRLSIVLNDIRGSFASASESSNTP
jgi:hypothetical protein